MTLPHLLLKPSLMSMHIKSTLIVGIACDLYKLLSSKFMLIIALSASFSASLLYKRTKTMLVVFHDEGGSNF